jgi:hypothetical protein
MNFSAEALVQQAEAPLNQGGLTGLSEFTWAPGETWPLLATECWLTSVKARPRAS